MKLLLKLKLPKLSIEVLENNPFLIRVDEPKKLYHKFKTICNIDIEGYYFKGIIYTYEFNNFTVKFYVDDKEAIKKKKVKKFYELCSPKFTKKLGKYKNIEDIPSKYYKRTIDGITFVHGDSKYKFVNNCWF